MVVLVTHSTVVHANLSQTTNFQPTKIEDAITNISQTTAFQLTKTEDAVTNLSQTTKFRLTKIVSMFKHRMFKTVPGLLLERRVLHPVG